MQARFIGDPANRGEGPGQVTMSGVTISRDWTDVPDAALAKLSKNGHFAVRPSPDAAEPVAVIPAPLPADADPVPAPAPLRGKRAK